MTSRNTESMVLMVRAKNLAKRELASVGQDIDRMGGKVEGVKGKAMAFGKFAGAAMLGVGAAAAGMAVVSIKAFADFEDRLNQAFAIMGDVAPEVKDAMSDTARAIAKETRIGAGEAADAFFYLASAGYDAAQSIEAVPQLAAFAQAGMMDMAAATDMAADAQSALGLKVKDPTQNLENLARVTDVLTKGNIIANASIEDMSLALTNKAGAALRLVNKDVEEGVAVLAAFADQGVKAEEGGTALGIVMRDLQRAAIVNEDAWNEFGVSTFDATGKMLNMADIVGQLEGLLAGMSDEQKKVTLAQLGFNDKSVQFLQTLLGTSDKIREYEKELREAGGTTQEVADKQMETLSGQFEVLGHRANDMAIGLGEELAPTIKDELLPSLNLLIDSTGDFAESIGPVLIGAISGVAEAMTSLQIVYLDLTGLWDEEARKKGQLLLLTKEMADMNLEDADSAKTLTTAMLTLAQQNAWTEDGLRTLIEVTGATASETLTAREAVLAHAEAAGYDAEYIQMLKDATMDAVIETAGLNAGMDAARHGAEDYGEELDETTGSYEELTEETEEALSAQQLYTDSIKAMTDPVFGAVDAIQNMQEATAEVTQLEKDGKAGTDEWTLAQLDLAEATIGAQDALDEMSPENLTTALDAIATATGKSKDEVVLYLEQLGILDGKEIRILLGVDAPILDYYQEGERLKPRRTGYAALAMGGSFYRGEPLLVGEDGWEFMVPGTAGTIVSNPSTPGGNFEDWMEAMMARNDYRPEPARRREHTGPLFGQVVFQGTPTQMLEDFKQESRLAMRGL